MIKVICLLFSDGSHIAFECGDVNSFEHSLETHGYIITRHPVEEVVDDRCVVYFDVEVA